MGGDKKGKGDKNGTAAPPDFKVGDKVWIEYHLAHQPKSWRFVLCLSKACGTFRPRMGLSDGFIPGTISHFDAASYSPKDKKTWPYVQYEWPIFGNLRGHFITPGEENDNVHPRFLRPAPGLTLPSAAPCDLTARPSLGLLIFRWGDRNEVLCFF